MSRNLPFIQQVFGGPDEGPTSPRMTEKGLVFVATPFTGVNMLAVSEVYAVIRDECASLGLQTKRVFHSDDTIFVLREITNLIESAEFIILDLTHQRPNLYYELGYAHGTCPDTTKILLIAKEGFQSEFDLSALCIHIYKSTDHLRSIVATEMIRFIQERR
ncbi:MAG: hypothetical protein NTZ35_01245 [Ignavibacteriales bacterium]|nr:hypothetical protein [Ignavibacteriales bacterium]